MFERLEDRTDRKRSISSVLMRFAYDAIYLVFALVSIPKFLIRYRQSENGRHLLKQRFGYYSEDFRKAFSGKNVIWVHAVSVGEVMAVRPLIKLFLERNPEFWVALSTTTSTGQKIAETFASGLERITVFYAPFDLRASVERTFRAIQPQMVLLVETEIWPNLISEAKDENVPIGIVNGRISPRSFGRYRLVRRWLSLVLRDLAFCLVQSAQAADFFIRLGMPETRVSVTGNMKYDQMNVSEEEASSSAVHPNLFSEGDFVLMGGSTSGHEEEILLRVFKRLKKLHPRSKLILAPRHPERFQSVARTIENQDLSPYLWSQHSREKPWEVLLVDQMGILKMFYAHSDVVFMGGSFVQRGGQNPVEAVFFRKPVIHGPHVFNFEEVYRVLDQCGSAIEIQTEEELFQTVHTLLGEPARRAQMGDRAWNAIESMKGGTARTLDYLNRWIGNREPCAVSKNQ